MYCGESSLVKTVGKERTAVSLHCNAWTCPDCAPQRKKRLVVEAKSGDPTVFLTLTHRVVRGLSRNQAAVALSRAWRLLRLRIMRRYKLNKLPFLAVFQATKIGWPHIHIVMRTPFIDQKWLSDQMRELLDSPVVDIRAIDNPGRVAAYVSRYIAKAPERFGDCKRYWQSQDYDLRPPHQSKDKLTPGEGWEREHSTVQRIAKVWDELGWLVRWTSHRTIECTIPP